MKITRDNYEIWFLDYLEERLDQEQREQVRLFLVEHPDLADELDSFVPAISFDRDLLCPEKELLKRSAFDDEVFLENQLIAAMEGDLSVEDKLQLEQWLANRPAQQDLAQLQYKCRLVPDQDILFPNKQHLRKKAAVTGYFIRIAAVAAVLLLFFYLFDPTGDGGEPVPLARTEPSIQPRKEHMVNPPQQKSSSTSAPVLKAKYMNSAAKIAPPVIDSNPVFQEKHPAQNVAELAFEELKPRSTIVSSDFTPFSELAPLRISETANLANLEVPLSEILNNRAQALQAEDTEEFISRRKMVIAGLKFFSKLPGNNLTGKKGGDGRLRTISFNTQLLAVSIPVNRQL